jgi:hypothetical protein
MIQADGGGEETPSVTVQYMVKVSSSERMMLALMDKRIDLPPEFDEAPQILGQKAFLLVDSWLKEPKKWQKPRVSKNECQ